MPTTMKQTSNEIREILRFQKSLLHLAERSMPERTVDEEADKQTVAVRSRQLTNWMKKVSSKPR